MTNENDTKELTIVQELPTPNAPQEGEPVPTTDERLAKLENKVDDHASRLSKVEGVQAGMLTPTQLDARIADAIEPLTKAQNERVTELRKQTEAHVVETETRDKQVKLLQEQIDLLQSQNSEQRRHNAIVTNTLTIMLGRDISDPNAVQMGVSVFNLIEDVRKLAQQSDSRADAAILEVSEMRADFIEKTQVIEDVKRLLVERNKRDENVQAFITLGLQAIKSRRFVGIVAAVLGSMGGVALFGERLLYFFVSLLTGVN